MRYGFIGGYGRSGTTVAMLAMAKSPEVFPLMETQFHTEVLYPVLDGKRSVDQFMAAYDRLLMQPKDMEFGGVKSRKNPDHVVAHFRGHAQAAVRILLMEDMSEEEKVRALTDRLFGFQAQAAGKELCLEKSPRVVTVAARVAKALPGAKFVHVHRDPRDVFCSVRGKSWGPGDVDSFVSSYVGVMRRALAERRCVPPGDYLTVRLEDLAADPGVCLGEMAGFLGLHRAFLGDAVSVVREGDAHVGRWSDELTANEVRRIRDGCGGIYEEWRA